jgi:hypothetical protein
LSPNFSTAIIKPGDRGINDSSSFIGDEEGNNYQSRSLCPAKILHFQKKK